MTSRSKAWTVIAVLDVAACGSETGNPDKPGKPGDLLGSGASGGTAGTAAGGATAGDGSGGELSGGATGEGGDGGTTGETGGTGGNGTSVPPPVVSGGITDVPPTDFRQYDCGGLKFNLSIPGACLTTACGLIIDVHGMSMSGKMQDNNTNLAELGRQSGYLVANPNATPSPPAAAWNPNGTDDATVLDFVQQTLSVFHVDTQRADITGHSQGGCDELALPLRSSRPHRQRDAVVSAQEMPEDGLVSSDGEHRLTRYVNDGCAPCLYVLPPGMRRPSMIRANVRSFPA